MRTVADAVPKPGFCVKPGLRRRLAAVLIACCLVEPPASVAASPASVPSRFGVDAPELAPLGPLGVGIRTLTLVQRQQPAVLAYDAVNARAPLRDRVLVVDLWYPAATTPQMARVVYKVALPGEPPASPVPFTIPGLAVREARALTGPYPLVIVSHGYSNATATMTWLTENLASKGYVVAAIRHDDPSITDPQGFPEPLLRRPLDIAFVAAELRRDLAREHLIDPDRVSLVGYSMGGYGVLTAAGATLDPKGPPISLVPGGLLSPYVRGGTAQSSIAVSGVRAVVALAPAGGGQLAAWGAQGLQALTAPMLLIAGDEDHTVDYLTGAHAIFELATNAPRYLLTFRGGGHSIGLNPAPEAMRQRLWDQDWFEDPVWRKDRINAINAHFITAFLDLYLKGDESRAAYLKVPVTSSSAGEWPDSSAHAYDAYSPGNAGITVWKGFQRNHAAGLELLGAAPASGPR
jgi:predicted dienelactone hydrolase